MMERRFDTNDFEHSLKEQADKFFLIPSERVWKSIYNDLHPGSKWPSFAVGLILLIGLFWIGNTHKRTVTHDVRTEARETNIPVEKTSSGLHYLSHRSAESKPEVTSQKPIASQTELAPLASVLVTRNKESQTGETALVVSNNADVFRQSSTAPAIVNIPGYTAGIHPDFYHYRSLNGNSVQEIIPEQPGEKTIETGKELIQVTAIQTKSSPETKKIPGEQAAEKPLTENSKAAQQSLPAANSRKKNSRKAAWTFFVTPERSNVHFEGTNLNESSSGVVTTSPYSSHDISTQERFGLQTGADVNYKLTKTIDFTSGFHLNYTGYNIMADLAHPSLATVTFRNSRGALFTKNYISFYGNDGNGSIRIANYNMQFAIPVGLQWTLFEKDNVKVSVVSTVEPFLILGSQAYIRSGDGKKFVNDPDLIRKVNLNGNFGSVITFSSHKVDWKIGPSIRYQFLSTYQNVYPVKEHLVNYGIRIGISKPQ